MIASLFRAFGRNFLGHSPKWYKLVILLCLILNPLVYLTIGSVTAGWLLVGEFIFALAMTPKCYPLQPGGLLALEAVAIGMTSPENVLEEVAHNFEVVLLLVFMVAGIFFMKELLFYIFTRILIGVRSKVVLSLLFCSAAAVLSAFLDALTVAAVLISVCVGFYRIYHRIACGQPHHVDEHDHTDDSQLCDTHEEDLHRFRLFLRSLLMHGAVGTALGGVSTLVGEPQNLLIANIADWNFTEFFMKMAPVSLPVFVAGLLTCAFLEKTRLFGYGTELPDEIRSVLSDFVDYRNKKRDARQQAQLIAQAVVGIALVLALALHVAAVGLVGLMVLVLLTAINGITEEHRLGKAFEESLPFTALLVTFFAVVSVIHQQELFEPIIEKALEMDEETQPGIFFIASGVLSMISDNVFVATVYINQVYAQFDAGAISREHFDSLAIAINTGTNLPSVATPNGQAAFLFLLTSSLAPLIHLSYGRMVLLALPYTIVLSVVGFLAVYFWL